MLARGKWYSGLENRSGCHYHSALDPTGMPGHLSNALKTK